MMPIPNPPELQAKVVCPICGKFEWTPVDYEQLQDKIVTTPTGWHEVKKYSGLVPGPVCNLACLATLREKFLAEHLALFLEAFGL